VEYGLSDYTIQVNEILAFSIKSSEFLTSYKQEDYQDCYFNFDIIWYNGNFSSSANSKVDIISSCVGQFNIAEEGYSGNLPDDMDI
tara:strand:+ start:84 stop:341 length:258 start_codon:yes stop_codon:yes gene_type:complete